MSCTAYGTCGLEAISHINVIDHYPSLGGNHVCEPSAEGEDSCFSFDSAEVQQEPHVLWHLLQAGKHIHQE